MPPRWLQTGPGGYYHAVEDGSPLTRCGLPAAPVLDAEVQKHLASRCMECRVLGGYGRPRRARLDTLGFGKSRGPNSRVVRRRVLDARNRRLRNG